MSASGTKSGRAILYRVSTLDREKNTWKPFVTRCRKWHLRKVIRTLHGYGYRDFQIIIQRRPSP